MVHDMLAPPGHTASITARRALVIAPHFDDDIIGCGGLLAQLAAAGTEVTVLFLSDGAGGVEDIADRNQYAERRRGEAVRALELLGITKPKFLYLPDGALASHIGEAADGIAGALIDLQPDLLLGISPLEATIDHRAAFTALHAALFQLHGGAEFAAAVDDMRILLFEINHPGYPDLFIDVSNEIELIAEAMKVHESQLERHNYLEGTIGIRQYRAVHLDKTVRAAEGYRQLKVLDFVTNSPAGIIRRLGGTPKLHEVREGPKVSVIVRTKDRPKHLSEALASLADGTYRNVEVVLVNDGGSPPEKPTGFPFALVLVDLPANRGRAAAANAGIDAATGDWIAFLDDDDLALPEHLETLVTLASASEARVVYTDAAVGVYELDGEVGWKEVDRRLPYSRDFDPELLLFDNYIPFNTLLIERDLLAEVGPLDAGLPFFEDWDLLIRLATRSPFSHLAKVTCEYRHFRGGSHHVFGERPDQRPDFLKVKARVISRHADRHTADILARVVNRLRAEKVNAEEATSQRMAAQKEEYHRLRGEREGLITELAAHRTAVAQQQEEARRLYAEIERLGGIIEAMEGTKAWRAHRWFERLRGK